MGLLALSFVKLVLAFAVALLVHYVVRHMQRKRLTKGLKELPHPPEVPILQSIPILAKYLQRERAHLDGALLGIMKEYNLPRTYQTRVLFLDFVCVTDPDFVREILLVKNYPKSPTYAGLKPFIGPKSMIIAHAAAWRRSRTAFNQAFTFQFLKSLVPVFVDKTLQLVTLLKKAAEQKEVVLLHEMTTRLTMDVILKVTLSEDYDIVAKEDPPEIYTVFMELLNNTANQLQKVYLQWARLLPWNFIRWYRWQCKLDAHMMHVIKKRLKEHKNSTSALPPTDILSMALNTPPGEGASTLDPSEVLSQVKTFLFAGHDTTATALAFAVYEISLNSQIQAAVLEEIDRVLGDRHPTADDLNDLKYLTAVIKESLRMWPPGGTARMAPVGASYKGYDIGGKVLYIPHYPTHRDPELWGPDAGVFRPERWFDEAYISRLHPAAYQPFSKGQRDCIGQTFAMMEAKTLLAILYQHFTFEYAGSQPEEQGYKVTSYPMYRVPVKIHLRNKNISSKSAEVATVAAAATTA